MIAPPLTAAALAAISVVLIGHRLRPPPARCRPHTERPTDAGGMHAGGPHLVRRLHRRSRGLDPADLAAWCDGLARAVRSGATLTGAVRSTTPPASAENEIRSLTLALDRGVPLDRAAQALRSGGDLAVALTVVRACATTGAPAAEALDRAAAALRARAAEAAERRTQSEQSRLSALVMTVLPLGMLALLMLTSSSVRTVLASPSGIALVAIGGVINIGGWRWMQRIIERAAR